MSMVRGEGSLGGAIVASLVVGLLVSLGTFGAIGFLGGLQLAALLSIAVGTLTTAFLLWLFLARGLRAQDIWQSIKDIR